MRNRFHYSRILFNIANHPATLATAGLFWLIVAALQEGLFWDEARWAYVAREWVHHGAPLYKGVIENKTPGIIFIFAMSDLLFGPNYWFPRVMGIFCMGGTAYALYRLGKTWWDHSAGLMAMTVFLLASAWWSLNGAYPASTESFMDLFTVLAFCRVARISPSERNRLKDLMMAGFLIGWAIAFKQIAVASAAALFIFAIQNRELDQDDENSWRIALALGFGMLLATLISIVPLLLSGVSFRNYIEGAWLLLLNPGDFGLYPGSGARWTVHLHNVIHSLARPDMIAFLVCCIYLLKNKEAFEKRRIPIKGLLAWMICDAVGVHASGYYFAHQFKQLLPSLSLAIGISIRQLFEDFPIRNSRIKDLGLLGTVWILTAAMMGSPRMPTISRAWNHLTRPASSPAQLLGQWVGSQTQPTDYIYAIQEPGDPVLYYSGRQSASRYYNTYYIDAKAIPEVSEDLAVRHPPRYIILWENQAPAWLWKVMAGSFEFRFNRTGYWVYERTEKGRRLS